MQTPIYKVAQTLGFTLLFAPNLHAHGGGEIFIIPFLAMIVVIIIILATLRLRFGQSIIAFILLILCIPISLIFAGSTLGTLDLLMQRLLGIELSNKATLIVVLVGMVSTQITAAWLIKRYFKRKNQNT